jgi:putative transposase
MPIRQNNAVWNGNMATSAKPIKYNLKPTLEQEQLLERTLMLCRHVYNAALSERREAWRLRDVSVT